MPDTPNFVVNDRRKFTAEGELRHDSEPAGSASAEQPEQARGPQLVSSPEPPALPSEQSSAAPPVAAGDTEAETDFPEDALPPGPTPEQSAEATRAYEATVERLDTALRAADPGGERMPEMNFERLTQSLYTQALLLLGGAAQPGETPRVDILGARQTIDMLAVLVEKTRGNLSPDEDKLLQSALFDLQMGFLEITQALARQARQAAPGGPGSPAGGAGPRIVR